MSAEDSPLNVRVSSMRTNNKSPMALQVKSGIQSTAQSIPYTMQILERRDVCGNDDFINLF